MFHRPELSFHEVIRSHSSRHPAKVAMIGGARTVTWREFRDTTSALRSGLTRSGFGGKENICGLLANTPDAVMAIFGSLLTGGTFAPLSNFLTDEQMVQIIDGSEATCLFASAEYRQRIDKIRGELRNVRENGFIAVGFEADGWVDIRELIGSAERPAPSSQPPALSDEEYGALFYSSGTTGLPKGILRSHAALVATALILAIESDLTPDSCALVSLPLSSGSAWLNLLSCVFYGATVVLQNKFDASEFLKLVNTHAVTHAQVVPTQLEAMLGVVNDHGLADHGAACPSLRCLLSLGSALALKSRSAVASKITENLYECYGATEGFGTMARPRDSADKPNSVGRPFFGSQIRVISDDGQLLPSGGTGEIAGRSPFMMVGYYKNAEETKKLAWADEDGDIYYRSGDLGHVDEDGYLYVTGRKKDMIISGGQNIYPADIERILMGHDDIEQAVVIPVPHNKWGETPVALVSLKAGGAGVETLLEWANGRLAVHQRLSQLVEWSFFPRNSLGKIVKSEIVSAFFAKQGNST